MQLQCRAHPSCTCALAFSRRCRQACLTHLSGSNQCSAAPPQAAPEEEAFNPLRRLCCPELSRARAAAVGYAIRPHRLHMSAGYNCVGQSHHALSLCAASMFATTSPEKYGLAQLSTLATHQRPSPSTCGTHCKRASYHASPAKLASRLGDKQAPAPADVLACQRRWDGL